MTSVKATLHTFTRKTPADATWQRAAQPEPAVVGATGIGWAEDFQHLAKKDEPIKREGDKRTPAGIFRIAGPFGFEASKIGGYTKLQAGKQLLRRRSRPRSSTAGSSTSASRRRPRAARTCRRCRVCKRGLMVDYPARRGAKAGSCIFIQVWDGAEAGTKARIGMPEERITVLQEWSGKGFTAIAIVTENAADRFKGCLPINSATSRPIGRPRCRCRIRAAPRISAPSWGADSARHKRQKLCMRLSWRASRMAALARGRPCEPLQTPCS